ncbi:Arylsulfatase [Polystyrenella longa]|uniref:Arylsulfatase n=1 Tax=Polystyrenella longa TaxID=2528007 RepID=A0A518CNT3_9PLAN|nr:sulfatase [Polystyrenella longa]QDU80882.1 Arylsulfatase [Polystyrenella longa]
MSQLGFKSILNRFSFLCKMVCFSVLASPSLKVTELQAEEANTLPNVVIVFTDDQGYADLGCFGAEGFETPHIDQLAADGRIFTNFYVAQAVCSASRAALLSGCYPNRIGIRGALGPGRKDGINPEETLLPEIFKQRGYSTAHFGKWHLGDAPEFLPTRHGFDEYFGIPYSNDMWPKHPTAGDRYPPLPLIEDEKVVELNPDQSQLTKRYTEHAIDFIERNQKQPFFLYLAHSMPHVPIFASEKFAGTTERGLYGDVISEIDWSVGQIQETLKRLQLDQNTIVIFTSDNGPWLSYGPHGGSAHPLREGKGTAWEGGVRVPCVMSWPGHIPSGTTCHELAATIDILPTLTGIVGADLPEEKIDGLNILPLLLDEPEARTPHEVYYYYWVNELHAVRSGPWKLHFPHSYRHVLVHGEEGLPGKQNYPKTELELYNLDEDISESHNVLDQHPEIVQKLKKYADAARADLGDQLQKVQGANVRGLKLTK